MMNFIEKMKIKTMLKECDFELAEVIIREKFDLKSASYDIADRVEDFLLNPCYKTAKKLVDIDPIFAFYFKECSGNGLYVRKYRSQEAKDQVASGQAEAAAAITEQTEAERIEPEVTEELPQSAEVPKRAIQPKYDEAENSSEEEEEWLPPRSVNDEGTFLSRTKTKSKQLAAATIPEKTKKAESEVPLTSAPNNNTSRPIPKSSVSFDNVISTLQKDMEQLEEEIRRTQVEMDNDFAKRIEGEKWIEICEQALYEFDEAIKVLKSAGK